MTNEQQSELATHSKYDESTFAYRMLWIMCHTSVLIKESRSGLLKGNVMLLDVLLVLYFVPNEVYITHIRIVYTDDYLVNSQRTR
jgi:hypothetical protein